MDIDKFCDKVLDYVAIFSVVASIILALIVIFCIGIAFFTVIGFALVFLSGFAAGIYVSSRLFIACTKIK